MCYHEVPAGTYRLEFNNRNTKKRYEISSKLTIKTQKQCEKRYNNVARHKNEMIK